MTKLYHSTTQAAADEISRAGFRDSELLPGIVGCWLADSPLNPNDSVPCEVCFAVEIPFAFDLTEFEVVEEGRPGAMYREWLIPAEIVNRWPRRLLPLDG